MIDSSKSLRINDSLMSEFDSHEIAVPAFPNCSGALALHQPDPDLPESILGTCRDCKSWYLIEAGSESIQLVRKEPLGSPTILTRTTALSRVPARKKRHA
jgi:hypothetical protein